MMSQGLRPAGTERKPLPLSPAQLSHKSPALTADLTRMPNSSTRRFLGERSMAVQLRGRRACLLVIDVQQAFDQIEANGIPRNNPNAVTCISHLLKVFRAIGGDIIHIRHASLEPDSLFQQKRSGFQVKAEAAEEPGETVIIKNVNSSFIGTDLEATLDASGIEALVIVGATTNHCVETTTRMAGNMGYDTYLVNDATWTFDRKGIDGRIIPAADIHHMTLSNLSEEFATIVNTAQVTADIQRVVGH